LQRIIGIFSIKIGCKEFKLTKILGVFNVLRRRDLKAKYLNLLTIWKKTVIFTVKQVAGLNNIFIFHRNK
jgi:hypothetical protein